MRFLKVFLVGSILSFGVAGAGLANPGSAKPEAVDHVSPVTSAAYGAGNEAPIVSGRSAAARHKSKMHHLIIKPEPVDAPLAGDVAPQNN